MVALEVRALLYPPPRAAGDGRLGLANFAAEARSRPKEGHARLYPENGLREREFRSRPYADAQRA